MKIFWTAILQGFRLVKNNDPLILASSTAFFATFGLSPVIIILVTLFSLYPSPATFNNQLFKTVAATVGPEAANEIELIVSNFRSLEGNFWLTIGGTIFLLFIATTLIGVVKYGINRIWHVRPKIQRRLVHFSRERGTGILLLVITAMLFLINFVIDSMMAVSFDYLVVAWPKIVVDVIRIFHGAFGLIIITVWFILIFKWLPDASVPWDVAMAGGLFTGVLFTVGKIGLRKLLIHSRMETIFGTSASIALLLLFIFYVSFMLYYGAAYTYSYGQCVNKPILPGKYADEYEEKVIDKSTVYPGKNT